MIAAGLLPPPDPPAINPGMEAAMAVWSLMGRRMDWTALEIIAEAFGIAVNESLVGRLLLLQAKCST